MSAFCCTFVMITVRSAGGMLSEAVICVNGSCFLIIVISLMLN